MVTAVNRDRYGELNSGDNLAFAVHLNSDGN